MNLFIYACGAMKLHKNDEINFFQKYTCLHVAVMFGHTVVVNLLLNKGVYQDCTGNDQV